MVEPLRRVLVRPPHAEAAAHWRESGWRAEPDAAALAREHEALCELLAGAGAEVIVAEPLDDDPDAIYAFDPAIATEHGIVLLRPGKAGRRAEVAAAETACGAAGVPIAGRLDDPATAEGGDFIRLDARDDARGPELPDECGRHPRRARLLPGVETVAFDLPHWRGEARGMHLLSLISPIDVDLAVAYLPLLPVRLAELLARARASSSCRCPTASSTRWGRTSSPWRRASLSRSKATRKRAAVSNGPVWRCSSTAARSSRGRATAGLPA